MTFQARFQQWVESNKCKEDLLCVETGNNKWLVINDQGGERMDIGENVVGTLRASGNVPLALAMTEPKVFVIPGNSIGRQPQNGGRGQGWSTRSCYTLTTVDIHCLYKVDEPKIMCSNTEIIAVQGFVRRILPVEAERLMNLPDNWTNIPNGDKSASDAARYKACGNSIVVACMEYILRAILHFAKGGGLV